jgi:hypothetical protein
VVGDLAGAAGAQAEAAHGGREAKGCGANDDASKPGAKEGTLGHAWT